MILNRELILFWFFIIFVFFVQHFQLINGNIDCSSINGNVTKGVSLSGYLLTKMDTTGKIMCAKECYFRRSCVSFNFDRNTLECELNYATDTEYPGNLISNSNAIYSNIITWTGFDSVCKRTSCAAGHKCLVVKTGLRCIVSDCITSPTVVNGAVSTNYRSVGKSFVGVCNSRFASHGETGVTCKATGSWNREFACHRKYGDWILVARFQSGNSVSVTTIWYDSSKDDDTNSAMQVGCTNLDTASPCSSHYRSGLINKWGSLAITQVKVALYTGGSEKAYVTFDGTGTDNSNWFVQSRILQATWSDVKSLSANFFGISTYGSRKFYMSRSHAGCNADYGWFLVTEGGPCFYETGTYPRFIYSSKTTYGHTGYESNEADIFAVFMKVTNFS